MSVRQKEKEIKFEITGPIELINSASCNSVHIREPCKVHELLHVATVQLQSIV